MRPATGEREEISEISLMRFGGIDVDVNTEILY